MDETLSRRALLAGVAGVALLATGLPSALGDETAKPPTSPTLMPAAFVGHGSPMLAVNTERGREFRSWAVAMGQPVAVLIVSAHYERRPVTIGATRTLPLIYDFRGFPKSLYEVKYAAPGAPKLARRVTQVLEPLGTVASQPERGLDHGAWVPLKWMYPDEDVPVLSLSLPSHDPRTLFAMGRALRPLREEGVLILGSGMATHNLRQIDSRPGAQTPRWASEFDAWLADAMARNDLDVLLDWEKKAPAARTNHPTVEHFVPMLLAQGARRDDDQASFPITGFDGASASRRCVTLAPPLKVAPPRGS